MINLYNSDITDILPKYLGSGENVIALGYAIKQAMQRFISYCTTISVYAVIDTVPEQVLDMLAVELKTQYYDDSMPINIKRSLVKNTLVWYMYTGTTAAVTELVEAVFGNGEIEEWFEYGGKPYYFKIRTSNINSTDEMIRQVIELVQAMQNVRSHLEEVIVEVMQQMHVYHGGIVESTIDSITIGIDMSMEDDEDETVYDFILLQDTDDGSLYKLMVVSGKLAMEALDEATDSNVYNSILLKDADTESLYEIMVVSGKLAMEALDEATDSNAYNFILLKDADRESLYEIKVVSGKLAME